MVINMKKRVYIDESKCNGCGECVRLCSNSVLQFVNGKVRVVNEKRCNRNGSCMQICPADAISFKPQVKQYCEGEDCGCINSELYNWPIHISSVSCDNCYLEDSRLLIAADCSAYAYAHFHRDFIKDHVALIACPKKDLISTLSDKCVALFKNVHFESVEVIAMNAPCCKKMLEIIREAIRISGKNYQVYERIITPDGEIFE